jgi:hypothetical protein
MVQSGPIYGSGAPWKKYYLGYSLFLFLKKIQFDITTIHPSNGPTAHIGPWPPQFEVP